MDESNTNPAIHLPNAGLSSILPHLPLHVSSLPRLGQACLATPDTSTGDDRPVSPATLQRVLQQLHEADVSFLYVKSLLIMCCWATHVLSLCGGAHQQGPADAAHSSPANLQPPRGSAAQARPQCR